ncbi:MAG: shikimate dehydrogenase [Chloroflexi bacterium]|nr:shikimate dehydrogenase [Chloroflexota bacterium]
MSARLGIIGHPVAHSLSPAIQGAALRAAGVDATYDRWDTPPDDLPARIAALREPDCLGANVTIPHKQAVLPLLDEVAPLAAEIGAVNTIVSDGGRLIGHNTDGGGFVAALQEAGFAPGGKSFLLVGAGGAARGIAFALRRAGADRLAISNRTPARAAALAAAVGAETVPFDAPPAPYDCVVNCTSAGMHGSGAEDALPCDPAATAPGALIVDIVYAPEETPLLRAAREAGLPVLGGLPMLIHQGALAFELWTGRPAPLEAMREAARAALAGGWP